jgi:hypothetical protein
MTHVRSLATAALTVVLAMGGGVAYAQKAAVDIDFKFVFAGKAMPAGSYTVERIPNGPIGIRSAGPGGAAGALQTMPIVSRLGRHDADQMPELVFDKVGGEVHLSEVWFPGEDGYLLLGTKEQHDHQVLRGPKSK